MPPTPRPKVCFQQRSLPPVGGAVATGAVEIVSLQSCLGALEVPTICNKNWLKEGSSAEMFSDIPGPSPSLLNRYLPSDTAVRVQICPADLSVFCIERTCLAPLACVANDLVSPAATLIRRYLPPPRGMNFQSSSGDSLVSAMTTT